MFCTFPLDAISVELNRVFASVHMSEHVSSTPTIPPGRAWSSNERDRVPRNPRPQHRWGQSRPTFAAERTQNQSASSAQWDTFEEVVDTEDEDNDGSGTVDPGDLQEYVRDELEVLATCMDNGENDAPIPGVDNSQLETACLHCIHPSRVRSGLRMTRTTPVDPLSHSVGSRVKPLFVAWTISMDSIVPPIFATGAECVKWSTDFGLSVTSRLLDSLMKFLRAGRSVRLWINLDADTPDDRRPISQTIASVLMRRRSLQLLSRLRRFRRFPGFCAVWTVKISSRVFGISTFTSAPSFDSNREEFSGRAVITSTTTASASARGNPECDDCQETTNFFSCLSVSKLCLESCDRLSGATESGGKPCVGNRETFSGSRSASQCQCSCGSRGNQSSR